MLFGSEQTRSGAAIESAEKAPSAHTARMSEAKDIEHVSRLRCALDLLHGAHHAQRAIRVVIRYVRQSSRPHPSADAGIDRDVLLAVRPEERHRIADDAGSSLELPQDFARTGIDRTKPAIHRPVKREIATGRQHAAVDRKVIVLN